MKTPALLLTSLVLALFGFASPARAATVITVGTDAELRAAVAACGDITFNFNGTITLTGAIPITCAVTIDGTGHAVTLSGGNSNRIFQVLPGGSLELINLTVANGRVAGTNSNPGSFPNAIFGFSGGSAEGGGVLVSNAAFTARSCTFQNCSVQGGNGADTTIIIHAGRAGLASGGAIYGTNSAISLFDCTFRSNSATAGFTGTTFRQGGGIFDPPFIGEAYGGAAYLLGGTLISTNGQFSHNTATTRGCALSLEAQANATIDQSTFATNGSGLSGGALYFSGQTLAVTRSTFLNNNSATYGGALHVTSGTATFTDCDFAGNQCRGPGSGGAYAQTSGNTSFSRCTFRENAASLRGGAIYCAQGPLELNNCTLVLNSLLPAGAVGRGGAIASEGGVQLLSSCTIASNRISGGSASSQGGGVYVNIGYFDVLNSLLQGNTVNGNPSNSFGGNVADNGHNLSSDSTPTWASGSSFNSVNALLLPLAANGGPTLTMALRANSPALNAADPEYFPATDQRGVARPQGAGPDIGAWEGAGGQITLSIFRENGSTNRITWLSDTGLTYRVEGAAVLNAWNTLSTGVPGNGGTVQYRTTNSGLRYFRVATEP